MGTSLKEVRQHPAIMQMTRYSFVGSKDTVKRQVMEFLEETKADELMVSSIMFSFVFALTVVAPRMPLTVII